MAFLDPQAAIEAIGLRRGMVVADFGSGAGFYAIPIAQKLGQSGKLYALDIRKEMLEVVRSKARGAGLDNIETVWANLEASEGSHLKANSTDLVIISNILFQVEDKKALIQETFRILKTGGKVLVAEWTNDTKNFGPKSEHRLGRKETEELFKNSGFSLEKEFPAGEHHYGLVFRKS